jgi:hypothetical protein
MSDHDEKGQSAMSYFRCYNYKNDRGQICNNPLKVVASKNIVISACFVDYDNIRSLILNGGEILKR